MHSMYLPLTDNLRMGDPAMKLPKLRVVATAALTALLGACAGGSTSPGVPPELKHSWEENFNRGDAAAVVALYAPDSQLIMSGSETARGPVAISDALTAMIKSGYKVHILSSENVGAADVAYVSGNYTVDDPKSGAVVDRGAYVEVWRRLNGAWKITIDINASAPLPTAPTAVPAATAVPPATTH
jgi:ketosteroid isomerase-like protein